MIAPADRSALEAWVRSLCVSSGRAHAIRRIELPQPALRLDGRRLRGVEVGLGLYLGRDGVFYGTTLAEPSVARPLTSSEVLERASLDAIRREFAAKGHARRVLAQRQQNK